MSGSEETLSDEKPEQGFFSRLFGKKDEAVEADAGTEEATAQVQGPLPQIQPTSEAEQQVAMVEEEEEKEKKGFFSRLFGKKDDEEPVAETPEDAAEPVTENATDHVRKPEQSFEEAIAGVEAYEKGLAHSFGDGVPQDDRAAFEAFLRAAKLGHTPAQYKIGVAYAYGEGVEKDPEQAVYWYSKAAGKGYALAQRNLGVMYLNGEGVEKNRPLAFAWHSILADSGNVMDIHRRDRLQEQLSEAELEEAMAIKARLVR